MLSAPAGSPPVVHGGQAAPRAWLAALPDALWICWDDRSRRGPPDPACWQRVELPAGGPDPRELRAQFLDAGTVVVRGSDVAAQFVRGDAAALPLEPAALTIEPRARPTALACGPTGHVPIYTRGRWAWIAAACPSPAGACVAPPPLPPLRRPLALALNLDVEARAGQLREVADGAQAIAGVTVLASIGVAFDPARQASRRLAWQDLQAARRPRLRELPPARARGPLAAREREVVAAVVCGGQVR
jgi:hypothetical protein